MYIYPFQMIKLYNHVSLQSHKMNNAVSSYSYNNTVLSGYNEALIDTGSKISSSLIPCDSTFCLYGNSSHDYTMNYQPHCSIIFSESTSILQDPFQEETQLNYMHQPWDSIYLQQTNNEVIIRNARKRATEASDTTHEMSSSSRGLTNTETKEGAEDRRRLKRFKEKQPKIQREKVRRRSQKLTDKITALQKLVSPYGKTDTASVLLEASISIKALQDRIKELLQVISVQETTNMIGEKGADLRSGGLCLVPSVFLEELERQSPMHSPMNNYML